MYMCCRHPFYVTPIFGADYSGACSPQPVSPRPRSYHRRPGGLTWRSWTAARGPRRNEKSIAGGTIPASWPACLATAAGLINVRRAVRNWIVARWMLSVAWTVLRHGHTATRRLPPHSPELLTVRLGQIFVVVSGRRDVALARLLMRQSLESDANPDDPTRLAATVIWRLPLLSAVVVCLCQHIS